MADKEIDCSASDKALWQNNKIFVYVCQLDKTQNI